MSSEPQDSTTQQRQLTVGLIGVGSAGAPVGHNVLASGYPLHICDIDPLAGSSLAKLGAVRHANPALLAAVCDVTHVFVPSDADVLDVCLGTDGVVTSARPGSILVICSTVARATAQVVATSAAEREIAVVDATFTGGVPAAERGTLTLFVGGDPVVVERASPVLRTFSGSINHLGPVGSGCLAKLISTSIHWGQAAIIVEGFRIAAAAGMDVSGLRDALTHGSVDGRTLRELEELRFQWHEKDLRNAITGAAEVGGSMPITSVVAEQMHGVTPSAVSQLLGPSPQGFGDVH